MNLLQIVDQMYPLHDICKKHLKDLTKSINTLGCHNVLCLTTELFSAYLNSEASSVSSRFDETEGQKVMKSGFVSILLDGKQRWNATQVLQEEGGYP